MTSTRQSLTLAKFGLGVLQAGGNWEFGELEGHLGSAPDFSRCPVSFCDQGVPEIGKQSVVAN